MEGKLFNALIEAGIPKGFIENINNLYIKTSLQPHEYQELRDFSERFVYQVFRRINDQSLLNNEQGVQECDATMPNSSNVADNQKEA